MRYIKWRCVGVLCVSVQYQNKTVARCSVRGGANQTVRQSSLLFHSIELKAQMFMSFCVYRCRMFATAWIANSPSGLNDFIEKALRNTLVYWCLRLEFAFRAQCTCECDWKSLPLCCMENVVFFSSVRSNRRVEDDERMNEKNACRRMSSEHAGTRSRTRIPTTHTSIRYKCVPMRLDATAREKENSYTHFAAAVCAFSVRPCHWCTFFMFFCVCLFFSLFNWMWESSVLSVKWVFCT